MNKSSISSPSSNTFSSSTTYIHTVCYIPLLYSSMKRKLNTRLAGPDLLVSELALMLHLTATPDAVNSDPHAL